MKLSKMTVQAGQTTDNTMQHGSSATVQP